MFHVTNWLFILCNIELFIEYIVCYYSKSRQSKLTYNTISSRCENAMHHILMIFSSFVSVKNEIREGHESQCE